jgi:hypothetical protein
VSDQQTSKERGHAEKLRGLSDALNMCGNDCSDVLYPAADAIERHESDRIGLSLLIDTQRDKIRELECDRDLWRSKAWDLHAKALEREIWEARSIGRDKSECGACDKPGEHCANQYGICSRTPVKTQAVTPMNCPHCDGIAPQGVLLHAPGCPEGEGESHVRSE